MDKEEKEKSEKQLLKEFFDIVDKLKKREIIRSDNYLGDIGEYMCKEEYDIRLNDCQREEGHDGNKNNKDYQVKFNNSNKKTNINFGDPEKYDFVLVVLGPNSRINPNKEANKFPIYKFTNEEILKEHMQNSGYSCGQEAFKKKQPEKKFVLDD